MITGTPGILTHTGVLKALVLVLEGREGAVMGAGHGEPCAAGASPHQCSQQRDAQGRALCGVGACGGRRAGNRGIIACALQAGLLQAAGAQRCCCLQSCFHQQPFTPVLIAPVPTSSSNTREREPDSRRSAAMRRRCPLNVDRLALRLCSSPAERRWARRAGRHAALGCCTAQMSAVDCSCSALQPMQSRHCSLPSHPPTYVR